MIEVNIYLITILHTNLDLTARRKITPAKRAINDVPAGGAPANG